MGDPVSTAFMVASSGLKIMGARGEAQAKKTAAQVDAIKMQTAAEAGKVRAIEVDAAYRDNLNQTLQTIDAIRTAQNVSIDSPTGRALAADAEKRSDAARIIATSNERLKALGYEGDARALEKSAQGYMTAALIKTLPEVLNIGQSIGKSIAAGM